MLELVSTADGSATFFHPQVGEHYHSRHGAVQESSHVFVHSGLDYFLKLDNASSASVLEIGFGTGLNFLLSAAYVQEQNITLRYTGIEAYPLSTAQLAQTNYGQYVQPGLWQEYLEKYPRALEGRVAIGSNLQLQVELCLLLGFQSPDRYDVIYFDAFASVHQPEMWEPDSLAHACSFLKPGGVFVTYAITGNLKRSMKALGFSIEKAKGAPGKREMLRAVKLPA